VGHCLVDLPAEVLVLLLLDGLKGLLWKARVIHVIDEDPRCMKDELMEGHRVGRNGFQQTWLVPRKYMREM
jgi:hypothetical protein